MPSSRPSTTPVSKSPCPSWATASCPTIFTSSSSLKRTVISVCGCIYIERNPVRANLVPRAELWNWSSAHYWQKKQVPPSYLAVGPVTRPRNWLAWVQQPAPDAELPAVRRSDLRGSPYGAEGWTQATAERSGLEFSLRPRGRPRKDKGQTLFYKHAWPFFLLRHFSFFFLGFFQSMKNSCRVSKSLPNCKNNWNSCCLYNA